LQKLTESNEPNESNESNELESMQYLRNQSQSTQSKPEVDVCPVCMEVPGTTNVAITACGHKFCMSCLLSSLKTRNTCPTCRSPIESERECIEPLSVSVASELIRTEERDIRMSRRIAVIDSFSGMNGRAAMIFSLCREVAFATAHSIAKWQKTPTKPYHYHRSWHEFDDSSDDDDDENESGSDNDD